MAFTNATNIMHLYNLLQNRTVADSSTSIFNNHHSLDSIAGIWNVTSPRVLNESWPSRLACLYLAWYADRPIYSCVHFAGYLRYVIIRYVNTALYTNYNLFSPIKILIHGNAHLHLLYNFQQAELQKKCSRVRGLGQIHMVFFFWT